MRKLLLIGPYPPPFGGPNVHMLHLRRRLQQAGATCEVLNIGPSRREEIEGALSVRSGPDFVLKVTRRARRGYHIHHFFNVDSHVAIGLSLLAALLSRSLGGQYSIGFVGGECQKYLNQSRSFWGRLFRLSLRLSAFVICNNSRVKEAIRSCSSGKVDVHAIESFHAGQVQVVADPSLAVRGFLERHDPVICSVVLPRHESGRPYHEVELLAELVAKVRPIHPNVGCVVLGSEVAIPFHREIVKDRCVADHFHFAGEVPHDQCLGTLSMASVFVRASMRDGNSSSVREALALGTPTVASRNPHHPAAAIQFNTNDPDDLARVVLDVLGCVDVIRTRLRGARPMPGGDIDREVSLLLGEDRIPTDG